MELELSRNCNVIIQLIIKLTGFSWLVSNFISNLYLFLCLLCQNGISWKAEGKNVIDGITGPGPSPPTTNASKFNLNFLSCFQSKTKRSPTKPRLHLNGGCNYRCWYLLSVKIGSRCLQPPAEAVCLSHPDDFGRGEEEDLHAQEI